MSQIATDLAIGYEPSLASWMSHDPADTHESTSQNPSGSIQTFNSSPTPSIIESASADILGSDQDTFTGSQYQSLSSSQSNSFIQNNLLPPAMSSNLISYSPPTNTTAPSASVLKYLVKLSTGNFVSWRRDLEIHLDSCGLGGFIAHPLPEPTVVNDVPLWRMHRAQVLLAIRTTVDPHNLNAISSAQHPFDAISILSRRHGHGENVGLAVANAISSIVFQKFDASVTIKQFVSNTQSLHNELNELTNAHPGFKLNNEILASLLVIKLPREQFNSLIQNLLSDLKNLSTDAVFNRLLTESQSMKPNTPDDAAIAFSAQQKSRKAPKGDRTSKEPSALCHLPSHSLSIHTNAECRSQNLNLNQSRNASAPPSRPMTRHTTAPLPSSSRGLSAISALTDAEKARLFDHLQTAHANTIASRPALTESTSADINESDKKDSTVYFSNVYSAVAQSGDSADGDEHMVLDTGADQFILKSKRRFVNLMPIDPIPIKTADGNCHLTATHKGDAEIDSYDDDGHKHTMTMPDALYCKDISVNLISAIRLCDIGCRFEGNSTTIVFRHPNRERLFARRKNNTSELWSVRPQTTASCLSVSMDVMHQRLGHLHSAALRRFCNTGGKSEGFCTSCIAAKSHRHPFRSALPKTDRLLYRVHSDVVGPFQTPTPSGNRYFVTFIDERSRFATVYLIRRKSDVLDRFKEYLSMSERLTGKQLCILKCDRGGEYGSSRFQALASTLGIRLEQGPAHTPEHNSIAERYNQTIMERSRAQMIHAALPKHLWGEIVLATSHILNMSPTSSTVDIPADTWQRACAGSGAHLSDHSFLRVLGCQALVHIPKPLRRKLDHCVKDLIHVGYESGSKAYCLWDPSTN